MVFMPYTDLNALVQTWVQAGIMSVLVVFVLVFAIVFAVLQKSKILNGKAGIDAVIALAIALGSLQFNWMTNAFYTSFFSNMGVGLIIMIGAMIFIGLVLNPDDKGKTWNVLIAVGGFIIFLVVLIKSYGSAWWGANFFWSQYGGYIIVGLFLIGIILAVILLGRNKTP